MIVRFIFLFSLFVSLVFGQATSPTTVVGGGEEGSVSGNVEDLQTSCTDGQIFEANSGEVDCADPASGSGTVNSGADQDLLCYQGAGTTIGPCSTAQILFGGSGNIVGATTGAAAMKFGAAGAVGTPAWTFGGDLDTGFWRIGANNIGLALGGLSMVEFGGGQTVRVWDQTSTTGVSTLSIRAGAGQTSSIPLLLFEQSDGTDIARFVDAASVLQLRGLITNRGFSFTNSGFSISTQSQFTIGQIGSGSTWTSGTGNAISFDLNYVPGSGTGVFSLLELRPIINQTGGASGITRGLYINPTLTAAADWRAIAIEPNKGKTRWSQGTDIASAATITIGHGNFFYITGTTNIDTINTCNADWTGVQVSLLFAGILTVGDLSGNVDVSAAYVTTAGDTLTLACMYDGTNYYWRELARSVN